MKLPNALQMRELDDITIQKKHISNLELMEDAATQAALFIINHYSDKERPVVIFAGPGNNGGDGLVIARLLDQQGFKDISVYLFNISQSLSECCQFNAELLRESCPDIQFSEITQQFEAPQLSARHIVIDALFGTGLSKPLSGGFAALIRLINTSEADVISIDMPSGLMCEDNTLNSPSAIIRATYTLTFGLPKLSLILADCQEFTGKVCVLDIGLDQEAIDETDTAFSITEEEEIKRMLKKRPTYGHKGTFGHAFLAAGKYGMAGAAILAAKACLKTGVGKITVHTPSKNNDILQVAVPEAILQHDSNDTFITSIPNIRNYQAAAFGPGIGTEKATALALIEQVSHANTTPLILDADAINILGDHKGWISQIPKNTVFTPHPEEMKRLGICNSDSYSILLEAMHFAQRYHFYMVLKGHYTAICTPHGKVYFNPTGNSGMATAGSGDVLTGIILSLTAQKYSIEKACRLGVYIHGLAGDLAAEQLGEHSVTASDIIAYLPKAFELLTPHKTFVNKEHSTESKICML